MKKDYEIIYKLFNYSVFTAALLPLLLHKAPHMAITDSPILFYLILFLPIPFIIATFTTAIIFKKNGRVGKWIDILSYNSWVTVFDFSMASLIGGMLSLALGLTDWAIGEFILGTLTTLTLIPIKKK